ncbi:MAG: Maf family protein [Planctomycetes bacterium]|nr:Maf family protein [Planctomycetota bacterium]
MRIPPGAGAAPGTQRLREVLAGPLILLASTSPRRRALLAAAGLEFVCVEPGEEIVGTGSPADRAAQRAAAKAAGAQLPADLAAPDRARGIVLGVDTVVDVDGVELGKPADPADAARMIALLQGRTHVVHTALAAHGAARHGTAETAAPRVLCARATVRFAPLDRAAIDAYVAGGSWLGKAGGYGIQDDAGRFATCIDGDLDTVIGLSVAGLRTLLVALSSGPGSWTGSAGV